MENLSHNSLCNIYLQLLQNSSLTWYSDNPDFTPCFQKTVLVWIPCVFLWLAALIDGYHIYSSKEFNIPWNKLNISKLIIICLLCILQIVNICQVAYKSESDEIKVFDVDYYDPGIKLLTFVSITFLISLA